MTTKELNILIVEDSPEDRVYLKRLLTAMIDTRWRFVEAENAAEGVTFANREAFDCIILDQHLPDGSGIDVLKRLSQLSGEPGFPVVVLSGLRSESMAAASIKAGALEYIPKKDLTKEIIGEAIHGAIQKFQLKQLQRRAKEKVALELSETLLQYRLLADLMPQFVFTAAPDGAREYRNEQLSIYSGLTIDRIQGHGWKAVVHPEDLNLCLNEWGRSIEDGSPFETEYRLRRHDGSYRWHLGRAFPLKSPAGEVIKWFGTCTDIDKQKKDRERLAAEVHARTAQLRRSLIEKDTLLQEVHHRVKNNLQVITSLLRMQASTLRDPAAISALKDSQQRVLSIALLYERLSGNSQLENIDFGEYVKTLVQTLIQSYAVQTGNVVSHCEISSVFLNIDQAIPCGLILNELMTNVLKYAYPNGGSGEVSIELKEIEPGRVRLSVSDHGIGLPAGWDWKISKSLGLPIVDGLTKQLDGTLTIRSEHGTQFILEFPKQDVQVNAASAAQSGGFPRNRDSQRRSKAQGME